MQHYGSVRYHASENPMLRLYWSPFFKPLVECTLNTDRESNNRNGMVNCLPLVRFMILMDKWKVVNVYCVTHQPVSSI
jgi:hypothetical protein